MFFFLVLIACERSTDPAGGAVDPAEQDALGLQGLVVDPGGSPIADALVEVGGLEVRTDAQGFFAALDLRADDDARVTVTRDGYTPSARSVELPAGAWAYTELTLAPVERLRLGEASSGGTLETENGLRLEIPAGAVVHEDGTSATGAIRVEIALLDEGAELAAVPLPLAVATADGEDQPIFSTAAIYLALWAGEEELGLAASATLWLPTGLGLEEEGLQVFAWSSEAERWREAGEVREDEARIMAEVGGSSARERMAVEAGGKMDRWFGLGVPGELPKALCSRLRDTAGIDLTGEVVGALWCRDESAEGAVGIPCHYGLWKTDSSGRIEIEAPKEGTMILRLLYGEAIWGPIEVDLSDVTEDECYGLGVWTATDADLDDDGWPSGPGPDCQDDPDVFISNTLKAADVHPFSEETWYDGIDQDCAGGDDLDQDGDGDRCDPAQQPELCPGLSSEESDSGMQPGSDCDDQNEARASTFTERCDEADLDEDCDGSADDADPGGAWGQRDWYQDQDGDCWGASSPVPHCDAPEISSTRCGRAAREAGDSCASGAYVLCQGDCADVADRDHSEPENTWPGAPERCDADEDYNCDNIVGDEYEDHLEEDRVPRCAESGMTDCNEDEAGIAPGLTEVCANGIDDDCDGLLDELVVASYLDADGDGHGNPHRLLLFCQETARFSSKTGDDCDDGDGATFPGAAEHEGDACTTDRDEDGYGLIEWPDTGAAPGGWSAGTDCDDDEAEVSPGKPERCASTGVDDDCDGEVDESDAIDAHIYYGDVDRDFWPAIDGDTQLSCTSLGEDHVRCMDLEACEGEPDLPEEIDCDDSNPGRNPRAEEICDDGDLDENCDGMAEGPDSTGAQTLYNDKDGDLYLDDTDYETRCTMSEDVYHACDATYHCEGTPDESTEIDCDDRTSDINPGARERCSTAGIDDDCDDLEDEDDAEDVIIWRADEDGDGWMSKSPKVTDCEAPDSEWTHCGIEGVHCTGGSFDAGLDHDCDDEDGNVSPGEEELCSTTGVDDDCDGESEEEDAVGIVAWHMDQDEDGWMSASEELTSCDDPGPDWFKCGDVGISCAGAVFDAELDHDCNDEIVEIHPGAMDISCYGEDYDCDGEPGDDALQVGDEYEFASLQEAIDFAVDGDMVCVHSGTYEGVTVWDGVDLTITGVGGSDEVALDGAGVGPVVTMRSLSEASSMHGFTIMGGMAESGGGVYLEEASPLLTDIEVRENTATVAGGGVYMSGSSPIMESVYLHKNGGADLNGGGLYATDFSQPYLEDCEIADNEANDGGGVLVAVSSSLYMRSCIVSSNTASGWGGGIDIWSGDTILYDVEVSDNKSSVGGGVAVSGSASPYFWNVEILNNWGGLGGGLYLYGGAELEMQGGRVWYNYTDLAGGGLMITAATLTIQNVTLFSNSSDLIGGGVYLEEKSTIDAQNIVLANNLSYYGGVVYLGEAVPSSDTGSDAVFVNVVFAENANDCCGLGGLIVGEGSNAQLINAVFSRNDGYEIWSEGEVSAGYLYVYKSMGETFFDLFGGSLDLDLLGSDRSSDPDFTSFDPSADPSEWDFTLQSTSPLIDAGDPDILDPDGTRSDIGAYGGPGADDW